MLNHVDIGSSTGGRPKQTRKLVREGVIKFGGYRPKKIYGLLSCSSGKRMKPENRVFFKNEQEAINAGYRPCSHCLQEKYIEWKSKMRRNCDTTQG
jgi:methylphosphotriester-DNA--protein-cysteine methyltransferase